MKALIAGSVVAGALVVGIVDAQAMVWGGGRSSSATASVQSDPTKGNTSVPEPSALYAVGSAIALLGGAGWYIRRRR